MKSANGTHQQAPHDARPKETGCGAVEAGDIACEQAVQGEHESRTKGDDRIGGEDPEAGLQNHQNPAKANGNRQPPPPANGLAENWARERCDDERIS